MSRACVCGVWDDISYQSPSLQTRWPQDTLTTPDKEIARANVRPPCEPPSQARGTSTSQTSAERYLPPTKRKPDTDFFLKGPQRLNRDHFTTSRGH